LGKILVPIELLTREDSLTKAELKSIRENLHKTADMLEGVKFEGPVVDTIRQSHAHYDGTGFPNGLAGEDIHLSARIVSVANVFVSMVSARAYRSGLDPKEAAELIHQKAGSIFDPKPVITLMNYIENQGGYEEWRKFSIPNKEPSS
jgi:HD-GYP domain-containing protein (c-di-GMP phosphodiesterase class II)